MWSDGSPVSYVNWNDGEPNDAADNEDCTAIIPTAGGTWNDDNCSKNKHAICERKGKF